MSFVVAPAQGRDPGRDVEAQRYVFRGVEKPKGSPSPHRHKGVIIPAHKHPETRCQGCLVGTVVFLFLAVGGLAVLAGLAFSNSQAASNVITLTQAGTLPSTPYSIRLDATSPLAITLPNDLQAYVGNTYYVYSVSAQAHTITIQAGTLGTTWDGTNTVATFGGGIKDGFAFHVQARDEINIISNTNVVFS